MEENAYSWENPEYRKTYHHTCSHVMAQAICRLYPGTKLAIGPAIEEGFYYDIDSEHTFSPDDFEAIEKEMRKICKEKLKLERFELPRAEAVALMEKAEQPYKVELINDLPEDARASSPISVPARISIPPAASRAMASRSRALRALTGAAIPSAKCSSASTL